MAATYPTTAAARSTDDRALERVRDRLVRPMPKDGIFGWLLPILITIGAGVMRFWHITRPTGATLHNKQGLVFDEVYYAHDSFSLLQHGVETSQGDCAGTAKVCAAFIVHPPLGKWMIALGEWLFDHGHSITLQISGTPTLYPSDTLSFRFSSALFGTLSVLMLARAARRLFRSTALGCVAGLLLSLDGLEFVQSRISLLDIFIMFWVIATFAALLIDRDWGRRKLAERLERVAVQTPLSKLPDPPRTSRLPHWLRPDWAWLNRIGLEYRRGRRATREYLDSPWLGFRPWRWVAGLCAGAAVSVKWSGGYYLLAWVILTIAWDVQARRIAYSGAGPGTTTGRATTNGLVKDTLYSLLPLVVLPAVVYVVSWTGWFIAPPELAYYRDWHVVRHAGWFGYRWNELKQWWHYQYEIWYFSDHLTASHPYRSRPWGWLLMTRPIAYYYNGKFANSQASCGATSCSQEVIGLGNPAIWWISIFAFIACAWRWLGRRDWRGIAILLPFLIGYLPWCFYDIKGVPGADGHHRTMFFYYMVPEIPFMVLAVTLAIGMILGERSWRTMSFSRQVVGMSVATSYLALTAIVFAYFYPIYTAETITYNGWYHRMWFRNCSNHNKYQENGPCWI